MSKKASFILLVALLVLALCNVSFAGYGTNSNTASPTIQNGSSRPLASIIPVIPPKPPKPK
jgi:hypothetical protein